MSVSTREAAAQLRAADPKLKDVPDTKIVRDYLRQYPADAANIDTSDIATLDVSPAPADATRAPSERRKLRQQNLETLGNLRASKPDYNPTTLDMMFPRLSSVKDVDTAQFDKPGPAQLAWAGLKDITSFPGRTLAGLGAGTMSGVSEFASPPSDRSRGAAALDRAQREMAATMSAPTDLGNKGSVSGFLESSIKDPTNALFVGGPALAKQAMKLPVLRELAPLKPWLTGAAGREDAAKALDKMTAAQAETILAQRAARGAEHAKQQQALQEIPLPEDGPGFFGLEEGTEGANAAMRGYTSAAERGVAAAIDPRAQKIASSVYTPAKFTTMTPDWIAQKLGNLSGAARVAAAAPDASVVRRGLGFAVNAGVPTIEQAAKVGLPLATYSSLDAALSGDDRDASFGTNLLAGTALGTAGNLLKHWGVQSFPGASPAVATPRGPGRSVRQAVKTNIDELIGQDLIPPMTSRGYKERAERELKDVLGKQYGKLRESVLPSEVVSPDEILAAARENLDVMAKQGADIYRGPLRKPQPELFEDPGAPIRYTRDLRPEIQSALEDAQQAMLGKQHIYNTPENLPVMPPPLSRADLAALTPAQRAQRKADIAKAKAYRAEYESNVKEQLDTPVVPAEGLFDLRTAWNDPLLYKDPTGSAAQAKKFAADALHQAANKRMEQFSTMGPKTYGEMLAEADLGRKYALWSSFRDVLNSPRVGLQSRLSTEMPLVGKYLGNAAIDSYLMPTLKYTTGRYLQQTPGLASQGAKLWNAEPDTTGAY